MLIIFVFNLLLSYLQISCAKYIVTVKQKVKFDCRTNRSNRKVLEHFRSVVANLCIYEGQYMMCVGVTGRTVCFV